ncbi:putative phosphotransacetylase [Lachnotalea glycerini]|uniref:Phosphate propanoyltransferase n=1 Tax=Lachnotalea glycerini TaxID=1763509 RepID=A0A255I824_9FIRM|nr:phosphate propanoyltransferase [Lachnotalea glycerini]OYP42451.1 phosphate propanoyltransferase [Lachnotalea glycerini]PXV93680.1 putative phosphotransacetylase [Lachnotalea glycerini]RDY32626.1 phosphate propanoyltransferase [Lachnotalea glycerini]
MQEQLVQEITRLVIAQLDNTKVIESEYMVPIGISARHVHLTREHIDILFGKDYQLNKKKVLMGGQYAAQECVTLVGTKLRAIENVRILGPERKVSQVEVSQTDAIRLGIKAPIRESGNIKGSAPIAMVGPLGAVYLDEGCIVAKRHIHMSPEDAKQFGVVDNQIVNVKVGNGRGGIFEGVQIRVDQSFTLEMHIDTDEANGLGVGKEGRILIK